MTRGSLLLVLAACVAIAVVLSVRYSRQASVDHPFVNFSFTPLPTPVSPQSYAAEDVGKPGIPKLSEWERASLQDVLRKTPPNDRKDLRFAFAKPFSKQASSQFVVFQTNGSLVNGGNGGYKDFKVLNDPSCNSGYDPQEGRVFAAPECLAE